MDSYTITVTPNDDSGNSTTVTVDTSTDQARITNVRFQAPDGLTAAQMPSMDIGLLLQAITTPTTSMRRPQAPAHANTPPTDTKAAATTTTTTATTEPATTTTPAPAAAKLVKGADPRPTAANAAKDPAGQHQTPTLAKARPTQPTPKKTTRKKATTATKTKTRAGAGAGAGRVYRKMPADLAAVYQQVSTAAGIADHYNVPRHTAQGWTNRLKKQNPTIGR